MDSQTLNVTEAELRRLGWTIFRLGAHIRTRDDFFDAIRAGLPLDPPLMSNRSWDALSDSLWEGLHTSPATRLAIVWRESSTLEESQPRDYHIAHEILRDLTESLADPKPTLERPKTLVVLMGT